MKNIKLIKWQDYDGFIRDGDDLKTLITNGLVIARHKTSVGGTVYVVNFDDRSFYLTWQDSREVAKSDYLPVEALVEYYDLKWINIQDFK